MPSNLRLQATVGVEVSAEGNCCVAPRAEPRALAARRKMLDEKEVRIETERSVEDVVRRLNEAIASNRMRSAFQPQLAGTVTPEVSFCADTVRGQQITAIPYFTAVFVGSTVRQ